MLHWSIAIVTGPPRSSCASDDFPLFICFSETCCRSSGLIPFHKPELQFLANQWGCLYTMLRCKHFTSMCCSVSHQTSKPNSMWCLCLSPAHTHTQRTFTETMNTNCWPPIVTAMLVSEYPSPRRSIQVSLALHHRSKGSRKTKSSSLHHTIRFLSIQPESVLCEIYCFRDFCSLWKLHKPLPWW